MYVLLGLALTGWSLFLIRGGGLYMQSIADASSGVFTLQYFLPLMAALAVAIGATLCAGGNAIFYAASDEGKYFSKYLKSLLYSLVSHIVMAFFMIAIEGEDAEVYGAAAGIIGVILLIGGIINAICLHRACKEGA